MEALVVVELNGIHARDDYSNHSPDEFIDFAALKALKYTSLCRRISCQKGGCCKKSISIFFSYRSA